MIALTYSNVANWTFREMCHIYMWQVLHGIWRRFIVGCRKSVPKSQPLTGRENKLCSRGLDFLPCRNFWVHQFRDLLLPTFWAALWGAWSLHLYWAKERHLLPCHRCFRHEQPQQTTFVLEYHHQLVNIRVYMSIQMSMSSFCFFLLRLI